MKLQSHLRATLQARKERESFLARRTSAIVLQSAWRGRQQRLRYFQTRQNIIRCQAMARGYIARNELKKQVLAALTIQQNFRRYSLAQDERKQFLRKKCAAIKIQSHWRRAQQQKTFLNDRKKIVLCQSAVRRYLSLKKVSKMKTAI